MRFTSRHWAYFASFLFVALTLGPSLAHLFELPNKISLEREAYFTVQAIYRGWSLLGIVIFGALLSTLTLSILLRQEGLPIFGAVIAFLCLAAAQAIFWTWTYPANIATENWTHVPANWEALRRQWEYSHAAGACLNLVAMLALVFSVLTWRAKNHP